MTFRFVHLGLRAAKAPLEEIGLGLVVSVAASLINLGVALVIVQAGRKHNSITLEANARHLLTDVWTSVGVIAGVGLVALTKWLWLDPVVALLVAANIVWTGVGIVRRSVGGLMDVCLSNEDMAAVRKVLQTHELSGIQFHALRSRQSGARRFVSVHVLVPGDWTVQRGHELLDKIEADIRSALPDSVVFTHLESLDDPASWCDYSALSHDHHDQCDRFGVRLRLSVMTDLDSLTQTTVTGCGVELKPLRTLAIVGSHPAGLNLVPWDDPDVEIMVFNEAPLKPEKYPRWDICLQIHGPEVYTSLSNWVNPDYWPWRQQDHPGKTIWMQKADERVPQSVEYPLEGILSMIPYRYIRSSPAAALALAIYLGYDRIMLFGSELASNTEYSYQAINYAFWIGFAHGRGIDLQLMCWQPEFMAQELYGWQGELHLSQDYFTERIAELEDANKTNQNSLSHLREG